jgi:hypothetical protein
MYFWKKEYLYTIRTILFYKLFFSCACVCVLCFLAVLWLLLRFCVCFSSIVNYRDMINIIS